MLFLASANVLQCPTKCICWTSLHCHGTDICVVVPPVLRSETGCVQCVAEGCRCMLHEHNLHFHAAHASWYTCHSEQKVCTCSWEVGDVSQRHWQAFTDGLQHACWLECQACSNATLSAEDRTAGKCLKQCLWHVCLPADLLISKELDSRIGHNPDTVGAIALEHSSDALFVVHVFASLQKSSLNVCL